MLAKLELQELKARRTSQKRIFLYKVVEGLVPAIDLDDFLKSARPRRTITAKTFENYQATNIVEKQVRNNTRCFAFPPVKLSNIQTHSLCPQLLTNTILRTLLCAKQALRALNLLSRDVSKSTAPSLRCIKARIGSYDVTIKIKIQILMKNTEIRNNLF